MGDAPTDISTSYGDDEVFEAIHGDHFTVRFRYERLGADLSTIDYLDSVEGCTVSYNYLADVKLTASFSITEDEGQPIDYLRELIRPYVGILMPDGLWTHIPMGTFLLSSPTRASSAEGVSRDVKAYDLGLILRQNYTPSRYNLAVGAVITDAVTAILDGVGLTSDIKPSPTTAIAARSWDVGTSWAVIVNDLLAMIGYGSLYFTPLGKAMSDLYIEPANRTVSFVYATDRFSITSGDATQTMDLFDVPNSWVSVVSQPDRPLLTSSYTNSSPDSPTSTVSRGHTIMSVITDSDAASQAILDAEVRKIAAEASQVYDEIQISTAMNPLHGEATSIQLTHDPLGIEATMYNETAWELKLEQGALMTHTARRAVAIA